MKTRPVNSRFAAALLLAAVATLLVSPLAAAPPEQSDAAVERTRNSIRMLDDLYKTAVVLITENYVNDTDDLAAGSAAQALFKAMRDKKWHDIRLVDATGLPYEPDNSPRDAFEKAAIERLKAGATWHEELVQRDGQRYLRVATPIPVVLEKCAMCHDHYNEARKKGQPIGSLMYTLRVE